MSSLKSVRERRWRCAALCALLIGVYATGCGEGPSTGDPTAGAASDGSPNVVYATPDLAAVVRIQPQFLATSLVADNRLEVQLRAENRTDREQWFELLVEFSDGGGGLQATAERAVVLPPQAAQEIRVVSPTQSSGYRITVKPPPAAPAEMPPPPPPASMPTAQPKPPAAHPAPPTVVGGNVPVPRPVTTSRRVGVADEEVVGTGLSRVDLKAFGTLLAEKIVAAGNQNAATPTLVVLPFENRTTQQLDGRTLAAQLAGDIRKAAGDKLKVVSRDGMDAVKTEREKEIKAAGGDAAKAPPRYLMKLSLASSTARRGGQETSSYVLLSATVTNLADEKEILEEEYEAKQAAPQKE